MFIGFDVPTDKDVQALMHEAIREAACEQLFCQPLKAPYVARIKPGFDTACWSFVPPKHRVYLGTGIVKRAKDSAKELTRDQVKEYIKVHFRHEMGHAYDTTSDSKRVNAALKLINAPFRLFNLMEDARIEHRQRERDCAFDWLQYEAQNYSYRAESILFDCIQAEGDKGIVQSFLESLDYLAQREKTRAEIEEARANSKSLMQISYIDELLEVMDMGPHLSEELERERALALLERVWTYYERIIQLPDSFEVFPVMAEWLDEFGREPEREKQTTDLMLGFSLAADAELLESFDAGCIDVPTGPAGKGRTEVEANSVEDNSTAEERKGDKTLLQDDEAELDRPLAEKLANRLRPALMPKVGMESTSTPQKRISARHYALNRPFYRVKTVESRRKRKLALVIDCSGSMGDAIGDARLLVQMLSSLARQGLVEGYVILSSGKPSRWERFRLPMADAAISRIDAFAGAEGLEPTLKDNIAITRNADFTFVFTDAQISDVPINKSELHQKGLYTYGLYCGEASEYIASKLKIYFDKFIIRDSVVKLVDAMLLQLK